MQVSWFIPPHGSGRLGLLALRTQMFRPGWRFTFRPALHHFAGLTLMQVFWFNPPQFLLKEAA